MLKKLHGCVANALPNITLQLEDRNHYSSTGIPNLSRICVHQISWRSYDCHNIEVNPATISFVDITGFRIVVSVCIILLSTILTHRLVCIFPYLHCLLHLFIPPQCISFAFPTPPYSHTPPHMPLKLYP